MIPDILHKEILGNTLLAYSVFLIVLFVGSMGIHLLRFFVLRALSKWASRTATQWDDFVVESIRKFALPLLYISLFSIAAKNLTLSPGANKVINAISVLVVTFVGISFITHSIRFALFKVYAKRFPGQADINNRFSALLPAVTVVVWVLGIIFLLDNLGFEISAIVTGLGIGGVAVALAASVILNDLFAYFAIMFDQPFVIGDFIIIGDFMGTVEKIGIKTTRLRSLGGELLVFSNKDLTDSRIRNYKQMRTRRVEYKFGITYDTPNEKMMEGLTAIKDIVKKEPHATLDRVHFESFGDSSLNIALVYIVDTSDYNTYMDVQQNINLDIKKDFEKRGIQFAFPTHTLHIQGKQGLA